MIAFVICVLAIAAAVGLPIYSAVKKSRATSAATSFSTISATSTNATIPVSPTPIPLANSKNYGWVWLIVGILAAVIVFGLVIPALRTSAPSLQVTAPKKQLQKYTVQRPLEFLGAEHIVDRGPGWVKIQKESGRANFRVRNIPIIPGAKYKIHFYSKRETTGLDWLEINAGKGNGAPFCYKTHPASDYPIETIFFEEGMGGEAKYFYARDNFLKLWADNDLRIQLDKENQPYVEITYWE